jgi:hypothetical protein
MQRMRHRARNSSGQAETGAPSQANALILCRIGPYRPGCVGPGAGVLERLPSQRAGDSDRHAGSEGDPQGVMDGRFGQFGQRRV